MATEQQIDMVAAMLALAVPKSGLVPLGTAAWEGELDAPPEALMQAIKDDAALAHAVEQVSAGGPQANPWKNMAKTVLRRLEVVGVRAVDAHEEDDYRAFERSREDRLAREYDD